MAAQTGIPRVVQAYCYFDAAFQEALSRLTKAFAETSTGVEARGTSRAFKRLRKLGSMPPLGRNVRAKASGTILVRE